MKTSHLKIPPSFFCSQGVELSWAQDLTLLKQNLNKKELAEFLELYEVVEANPKAILSRLATFAAQHPHLPPVSNLLAYAYVRMRKVRKANQLIEESYHRSPDYLIAKINYADLLLRRGQVKKIPALFGNTFDLSLLYPGKKVFHYSEFRGFIVAMGFYHHAIKEEAISKECYRLAVLADPLHPSVRALEKKIFRRSWIKKIFTMSTKIRIL